MENLSEYLVKNPKQVLHHFKTLLSEKCLITAKFGDNHSFITAILKIDEKKQQIIIDCGPKEYLNKELLSAAIVNFSTNFKGIKVAFRGHGLKKAGNQQEPSLSIRIPEEMCWVQRRLFYRVRSPLSKQSYCRLSIIDQKTDQAVDYDLKLLDISITGFAIVCEEKELAEQIMTVKQFDNCLLVLNGNEEHSISFIPRNLIPINLNRAHKSQRVGCEFVDLLPRSENAFLRYMQNIERELKKNLKD